MIIHIKEDGTYEYPISFDELRNRNPNISFCEPLTQNALPRGYVLIDETTRPMERMKKSVPMVYIDSKDSSIKCKWTIEEPTEEELAAKIEEVNKSIDEMIKNVSFLISGNAPDYILNKYKYYLDKVYALVDDVSYPFNTVIPEIK